MIFITQTIITTWSTKAFIPLQMFVSEKCFYLLSTWINFYVILFGRCKWADSSLMADAGANCSSEDLIWCIMHVSVMAAEQLESMNAGSSSSREIATANSFILQTVYKRTVVSEECSRTSFRPGDSKTDRLILKDVSDSESQRRMKAEFHLL